MDPAGREKLELQAREHVERGDVARAASVVLKGYGPEVLGFLVGLMRDPDAAEEVFSRTSEKVWSGLSEFGWQCSLRTWIYGIARNSAYNHLRDEKRRARRMAALPEGSELSGVVAEVRTKTRTYLATEFKDRFSRLRDSLPAEDRELLMLRVDRQLEWEELARVLAEDSERTLDPADLKREAARLRKRFQLLKKKLLELGRKEGLLPSESGES